MTADLTLTLDCLKSFWILIVARCSLRKRFLDNQPRQCLWTLVAAHCLVKYLCMTNFLQVIWILVAAFIRRLFTMFRRVIQVLTAFWIRRVYFFKLTKLCLLAMNMKYLPNISVCLYTSVWSKRTSVSNWGVKHMQEDQLQEYIPQGKCWYLVVQILLATDICFTVSQARTTDCKNRTVLFTFK